jgi:hypothetical protein
MRRLRRRPRIYFVTAALASAGVLLIGLIGKSPDAATWFFA